MRVFHKRYGYLQKEYRQSTDRVHTEHRSAQQKEKGSAHGGGVQLREGCLLGRR